MRVKITLAYNGASFLGSQVQKESTQTINGQLEHALHLLHIECRVQASGRTDRGVHASRQVVHVDLLWTGKFGYTLQRAKIQGFVHSYFNVDDAVYTPFAIEVVDTQSPRRTVLYQDISEPVLNAHDG